jgi:hypothetical protein
MTSIIILTIAVQVRVGLAIVLLDVAKRLIERELKTSC